MEVSLSYILSFTLTLIYGPNLFIAVYLLHPQGQKGQAEQEPSTNHFACWLLPRQARRG